MHTMRASEFECGTRQGSYYCGRDECAALRQAKLSARPAMLKHVEAGVPSNHRAGPCPAARRAASH